jgi:peptide-methionine (S)-S-oxide reductase
MTAPGDTLRTDSLDHPAQRGLAQPRHRECIPLPLPPQAIAITVGLNHGTSAEAMEITFDPDQTSYRELLEFFFQVHDPTTLNRQGNDTGTSYRSAIFYLDDDQRRVAEDTIADVEASGLWPGKVVTEVTPAGPFWEAEPEHQNYLEHYPNGYTCHFPRPGWVLPHRAEAAAR